MVTDNRRIQNEQAGSVIRDGYRYHPSLLLVVVVVRCTVTFVLSLFFLSLVLTLFANKIGVDSRWLNTK